MKKLFLVLYLINFSTLFAQKDCEYTTNVTDSIGTYKSTKEFLVHERFFGGSEKSISLLEIFQKQLKTLEKNGKLKMGEVGIVFLLLI